MRHEMKALAGACCIVIGIASAIGAMPLFAHAQTTGGPVFISPVVINSDSDGGQTDWLTASVSAYIPPEATSVILQAEAATRGTDASILIRKDDVSSSEYWLLRGKAMSGGDKAAWANQGVFPVSSTRTFQYKVISEPTGGDGFSQGWVIRIVGYTTAAVVFIPPIETTGTNTTGWVPYAGAIADEPILPGATGVILEAKLSMSGPDGDYGSQDIDKHIKIRKDTLSPAYVLLRGRSGGDGDSIGWVTQGVFPVSSDGTFEYSVEPPSRDTTRWWIRIIGYTTATNIFIAPTEVASYTPSWYSISGSNVGSISTNWATYGDSDNIIPSSATGVILEAEAAMHWPDGDSGVDGYIKIRKDYTSSSEYVLLRGRSAGGGDDIAWANQGVFPLSSGGTFQYSVPAPGFNHGWKIKIVGYITSDILPPICSTFGLERTTTYDLQEEAYAFGYGVAVDSSNNTYVTGEQYAPATGLDMYVIKYNANGSIAWSAVYDNAGGNESGYGIAVTPSGSAVYVAGSQDGKAFIRKYDSAGSLVTSFGSGGTVVYAQGAQTVARAVALDTAENVYVAGHRGKASGTGIEALLLSYGPSGNLRTGFPVSYSSVYNSSALGIAVSGSSVYMTGYIQASWFDTDMFVRKYTTGGAYVWSKTYQASIIIFGVTLPDESGTETGYGVSVDNNGNVFVTGYTSANGGHVFLRKYSSAGWVIWHEVHNSSGVPNDVGAGVAAGNSGRVFIVGRQQTNNEDAFLTEYYTDLTKLISYPDYSRGPQSLCTAGKIGFVYETKESIARVYLMGLNSTNAWGAGCGSDPGYWSDSNSVKRLFYEFDWNSVPPEIDSFTAMVDTTDSNTGTKDCKGSATFSRSYLNDTRIIGGNCSSVPTANPNLIMDVRWHSVLSGFFDFNIHPYQGDKGGLMEYNEMAHGIALTNSTVSGHTTTSNDVYVVGYQASNGGSAFLNKYSCNASSAVVTGESAIANFTPTPTSGPDPLTVNVDARASAGTVTKYEWDWSYNGDPNAFTIESTGARASHKYTAPGTYTIALRITTNGGVTDIAAKGITVSPNQTPVADFKVCDANNNNCVPPKATPFTGAVPLRVNVDASASADPDEIACSSGATCSVSDVVCPANGFCPEGGSITSFSWDWGDGTVPGVGEKATHLYSTPKSYTITLTVTDNGGLAGATVTKNVSVVAQYVCTTGAGPGGSCAGSTPVCGPTETPNITACYACLEDANCGTGYQCLGVSCTAGTECSAGVLCPLDGRCPEFVTCTPSASATCPDGSACPASGFCPAAKNVCVLSGSAVDTQCYVEEQGSCVTNIDCTESLTGGVCDTASGACRYARCTYENSLACTTDADCTDSDGICNSGACVYIYDCAYGPGLGTGVTGLYTTTSPDTMPVMKLGVQPDGQACTQPTPDAPNNCEGINGCLYYNYYPATGTPIVNSNNSVANCVNTFEGGTGCVYYQYYSPLATPPTPTTKTNCLPRYAEKSKKLPVAGIPAGCFVVDKGTAGKEYNCTSVDGCYYYLDGSVDCTYTKATATACTTNAQCAAASSSPLMIPVCDTGTNLCEYQGNGCVYEPNPQGAISCPGAVKPATGGDDFVQCMLNPDGLLPGFLDTSASALTSCNTNADCPANYICLNGTCLPACQGDVDCATGEQCKTTCTTSMDCAAGLICDANVCVPPRCAGATPSGTLWNVTMANLGLTTSTDSNCRYSTDSAATYSAMAPFTTTDTTNHNELLSGLSVGSYAYYVLCQELSSSVLAGLCQIDFVIDTLMCVPGTICPNGAVCPASGICPATVPACAGAFPTGSLPFGTTATDIGLTTKEDASCRYSLVAIDPYDVMTSFAVTGTTSHSTNVTGLFTGANTYYAKCQDAADPTKITNACSIAFSVGTTCANSAMCPSGFMCIGGICQPPVCENASPTGALAPGTPSTTISMTTPADATCRYSTNGGDTFGAMTPFTTTGSVSHSSFVSGLVTGGNTHYVRCQDAVTNVEKVCSIPFSVGVCNQQYKCETGWMCVPNIGNGICQPPPPPCDPGTLCPDGQMCPASGICPPPPPCMPGDFSCSTDYCPQGSIYNAGTGACDYGNYDTFCSLNPTHPLCVDGYSGQIGSILSGITSCNTLGYTFTGTAVTPSGNCDLVAIILALLLWMAWIIALLAVLSGLRAGYLYITSMGDERKLILARRYLIYTTIGVGVSVLTFSIVAITRAILNI